MSHETGAANHRADPSTVAKRDQFADFLEVVLGTPTWLLVAEMIAAATGSQYDPNMPITGDTGFRLQCSA